MLSWLRLIRSRRVGPGSFFRLLAEHGSAREALAALPARAREAGIADYQPAGRDACMAEIAAGRAAGAFLLPLGDPRYPAELAAIADAPPLLWCRGDPAVLTQPRVALVGARNASSLGLRMARAMAAGLGAAGWTVVSGLARGIDSAAHAAALPTGTVAVFAGGIDVIYPSENDALAARIAEEGLILSEQPVGLQPQARHFPRRNRIVSGLAHGVVVVEAATGSGSLITARDALDQGREVMAVPGHPFDARAGGCNQLVREGATLVRGAADVIAALAERLGPLPLAAPRPAAPAARTARQAAPTPPVPGPPTPPAGAALDDAILALLGPSPLAEDQLIRDLALPAATVSAGLLALELDGRVARQPGGLLSRLR
jgi:DNA processing protein